MTTVEGILVLLLSCIGNAELWVILVNRRHSLKYKHRTLRKIRSLHDFGMVSYPPFIIALAGLRSNGLLRGGSFGDLPWSVQWLLAVTFLGLIPFVYSVIRWQLSRPAERLIGTTSENFDALSLAANEAERQAVIGDRVSKIQMLPFSQIYQLEVNQKRIRIGATPQSDAGTPKRLRLAHFSDVHLIGCPGKGFHDFVADRLVELQPDAFVFTGDLIDDIRFLDWAVESFEKMSSVAPGYFILGNHDWHLDHELIRRKIEDTSWVNVGDKSQQFVIGDVSVLVAGTEAPWIGQNPKVPAKGSENLRLLLSHSPDQRDYAVANNFDVVLCGHNHGGQVVLPVMGPVYSPSRYGVKYAGGVYQHREMVIHVSRGVAAKDPLRWNCSPEVSLLDFEIQGS